MIWTAATLILISATWRLWTGSSEFPQVPLLKPLTAAPWFIDWIALALLILSTVWLLVRSASKVMGISSLPFDDDGHNYSRFAEHLFLAAFLCLFLLNQHRLQPWAWQFFLYAALAALLKESRGMLFSVRWLTASIYFYSAFSKFDYQFVHGLGGRLAETLTETVGIEWTDGFSAIAFAMPTFELFIALALLLPKTRKLGIVMAAAFHGVLIMTLGPWGLDHHLGVLIWNFFFFLTTAVLFWPQNFEPTPTQRKENKLLPLLVTLLLVAYPIFPGVDHWLGWGLYSPNNSRCDLEVIQENDKGEIVFERFDLGGLSLRQLNVPLYPDARFQLGVAQAIQKQQDLKRSKIVIRGKSDRFTGERKSVVFEKDGQWGRAKDLFFLNSSPRNF